LKIYFLSGLGADKRVFQKLILPDSFTPVFLDWITPEKKESIESYAKRMCSTINNDEPFILVGLSFGGMLATEMTAYIQPNKTILISSAGCNRELPFYYRWAGAFQLDRLLPKRKMSQSNLFIYWCFGIKDKQEQDTLKSILNTTDAAFTKWAVHAIINWKRNIAPQNIVRIHGDRDRVLPLHRSVVKHTVNGGGHFMILQKATIISSIIEDELRNVL
jgi:pimeloyl-ACP methyl ester carboxylesterase